MRKRQKFVLAAVLVTLVVAVVQLLPLEWRYALMVVVTGLGWILAAWSLKEGLAGVEWLTVPLPPALFTAAVGLFFILLPPHWLARSLVLAVFGIGWYAQLLTANIFSVAAIRTIALFRAAGAVGFVMTLVTGFLFYNTLLSFRLPFWANGVGVGGISFLLLLPALWSVDLAEKITPMVLTYTGALAALTGALALAVSFWPVSLSVASLFLTTVLYVFLGLSQHQLSGRLFSRTVWEYVTIGLVVLITMLVTAG